MKSCLVNPSSFEVLVIRKSMEMNDVFAQSYYICKWRGPWRL